MVEKKGVYLEHIFFQIGSFALKDIYLEVAEGEYFVLTGPNGSGKTMIIKLIAGLEQPGAGDIFIFGRRMNDVPPWQRNIGYVPQDYVLFPERTVKENIEFGLEVRKIGKREIKEKVDEIANLLDITHLLDRIPDGLSSGEQQKVSIARALILKPSVLLLDEPLSSIDEEFRDNLCLELKRLQKYTGITTIHVSHNKKETELVADRVGYLMDGKFERILANEASRNG